MSSQPATEGAVATPATSYDDLESPAQMRTDCARVVDHLRLERAARAAVEPAPSLLYADFPREVAKREVRVSDAAARLAAALHLHLD